MMRALYDSAKSERGTMRTYSRQISKFEPGQPRKRIRMDSTGHIYEETPYHEAKNPPKSADPSRAPVTSSSPPQSDSASISSNAHCNSDTSPASSPPPRLLFPSMKTSKPAFTLLKRKRSTTEDEAEALADITSRNEQIAPVRPLPKKSRMTQMQIDLGGDTRKACKGCGMEYIPSNSEDKALHKEFHAMHISGMDMGKGFLKELKGAGKKTWEVSREKQSLGTMVIIDQRSSVSARNKATKVLALVNQELSAAGIADEILWGKVTTKSAKQRQKIRGRAGAEKEVDEKEDRYKVCLYLVGDKCVGLCLAERVRKAYKVLSTEPDPSGDGTVPATRSSSISVEADPDVALLGISRIWTSKTYRLQRIATALLDHVQCNFFYGIEVPQNMVAFSQPTESGGRLAERWFGQSTGWHVYAERNSYIDT